MIYVEAELREFCDKHGLPIGKETECVFCKKKSKEYRPFVMLGYAGIEHQCPCGAKQKQIIITPTTKDKIDFWKEII
jgi:hypothetical protein